MLEVAKSTPEAMSVTSTVELDAPTFRMTFTVCSAPTVRVTPEAVPTENPAAEIRKSYWPGDRFGTVENPAELLVMVWTTPVARSFIAISAFAMTAPVGSLTVPRMVPPATCARVGMEVQKTIAINPTNATKTLRDTPVELMRLLLTQHQIPWYSRSNSSNLHPIIAYCPPAQTNNRILMATFSPLKPCSSPSGMIAGVRAALNSYGHPLDFVPVSFDSPTDTRARLVTMSSYKWRTVEEPVVTNTNGHTACTKQATPPEIMLAANLHAERKCSP